MLSIKNFKVFYLLGILLFSFATHANETPEKPLTGKYTEKYHNGNLKYEGVLEELIKYNPSCFIASINKLDNKNCKQVEASYINEPHFYPREDLKTSLRQTKDFSKSCLAS